MDLKQRLQALQEEVNQCRDCSLYKNNINYVFARGNPEAKLMIVAEAPSEEEAQQGLPLVGKSGKLLNQVLSDLGVDSDSEAYITNILKCRPPNNRIPTEEECFQCFPYLDEQINLINPKLIIALGSVAMNNLINTPFGITKVHGRYFKFLNTLVIPIFHPSYVLRNGGLNSDCGKLFVADLKSAFEKLKDLSK